MSTATSPCRRQLKKACDCCRARKIRCDGTCPCSRCAAAQLQCTYLDVHKKKGPKGPSKRTPKAILRMQIEQQLARQSHSVEGSQKRTSANDEYPPGVTDNIGSNAVIRPLEALPKSDEDARQNTIASSTVSTSCTNTPPSEMQSRPAEKHLVFEKASQRGITEVFNNYISDAISKVAVQNNEIPCKAAVTMTFPPRGLVDCLMSLEVNQSKIGYLAMALFKVRVESVGQVRYITLNDGVRLTPNPEITLKGVKDGAIIGVFGLEIYWAITKCRMHEKELEEGNEVTECVSMILTSRPSDGAIINLSLGLKGGVQMRSKLYT